MPKKRRKFTDDGWAVWIDGDDVSTVYINDWLNPKGKSFVDFSIRIRGIKSCKGMCVYVPFAITRQEIVDISLNFHDKNILRAIFNTACIVDFKKNEYASEIAYNGKTVDIVHIENLNFVMEPIADGTLLKFSFDTLQPYLDNDEAYFIWRMPHKSIDEIFHQRTNVGNVLQRLRDLVMSPVVADKYGYAIRINEARLLPEEINRIGVFHRQKLNKAVVTVAINEDYEINDFGCYRIHRLEQQLYTNFAPEKFVCDDAISYQWNQTRQTSSQGQYNFHFNISKESISRGSMLVYMILLLVVGAAGNGLYELFIYLLGGK